MTIDKKKLSELAKTLTDDQRRLLREGLAGGHNLDPDSLAKSLHSFDTKAMFAQLAHDSAPAAPLEFKHAGHASHAPKGGDHMVLKVDRRSMTLGEIEHLAAERAGRAVGHVTAVHALDLEPSELSDATYRRLATEDLTEASASARRYVKLANPSKSMSLADIDGKRPKPPRGGVAERKVVVVVIVLGPIIIVVVFPEPDPTPPPEPPLTRW